MLIGIDVPSSLPGRGATVSVPEATVPGAAVTGPTANGCAIAAGPQSRVVSMTGIAARPHRLSECIFSLPRRIVSVIGALAALTVGGVAIVAMPTAQGLPYDVMAERI